MWDGRPIWSLYSTDCGGATANNEDGGAGPTPLPYLRGVPASVGSAAEDCSASPYHQWSRLVPLAEIAVALNRKSPPRIQALSEVKVFAADRFGRALFLKCVGRSADHGTTELIVRATALRSLLGESVLRSTNFTVSTEGSSAPLLLGQELEDPRSRRGDHAAMRRRGSAET